MNIEELKTMIASEIKNAGLNDVLDVNSINTIKTKVMQLYNKEKASKNIPDIIPESIDPNVDEENKIPQDNNVEMNNQNTQQDLSVSNTLQPANQDIEQMTTGNISAYTPEIPEFLNKIEPAQIIIFSQNELSEGAENLSNKPLRTFEDPDVKKSMHEYWIKDGKRKADVFLAKLEKIGEIEFDYANGTSKFTEKRFEPDFEAQAKYKENPYMANVGPSTPGALDINGQPNVLNQIANAVDLEKVVKDIVMGILRDQFMTNNTKATNIPIENNPIQESLNIKMIDLIEEYEKIDLPCKLQESIQKNSTEFLSKKNEEIEKWVFEGVEYYTPVNKITLKKGYIKP